MAVSMVSASERELFRSYSKTRDPRLRNQLVERHMPLAKSIARRYGGRGVPREDLDQIAAMGLLKAVERFDARRGIEFSSFAVPTIEGELRRFFRDSSRMIRIPRSLHQGGIKVYRARMELGQDASPAELAENLGMSVEEVTEILDAEQSVRWVSLEASAGDRDTPLINTLAGGCNTVNVATNRAFAMEGMRFLDEREQRVIYWRFYEDRTQREIAGYIGVSHMQVSRIIRQALQKIRDGMTDTSQQQGGEVQEISWWGQLSRASREVLWDLHCNGSVYSHWGRATQEWAQRLGISRGSLYQRLDKLPRGLLGRACHRGRCYGYWLARPLPSELEAPLSEATDIELVAA